MDYNIRIEENDFSYEEIQKIKEHAQKYDSSIEKKEFLKNVSAYEQKLILLESKNPYEVLTYLNEIDSKASNLVLNELNLEEISKILELFSAEDKKQFYETFSHLSLVNQFIVYDKNSSEYIEDLSFDRKVDLIDSSDPSTFLATSKVYESMPYQQREMASNLITNADAASVLNKTDKYIDDSAVSELIENSDIKLTDIIEEKVEEKLTEKINEQLEKEQELDEKKQQIDKQKTEFIKSKLEYYMKNIPEFAKLDINGEIDYSLLSQELRDIIDKDFELAQQNKEEEQEEKQPEVKQEVNEQPENSDMENESDVINKFQQAKQDCELNEITKLKNSINTLTSNDMQNYYEEVIQKTK